MKIGLSSYSLVNLIRNGEMTILEAIEWVAENGGQHIEIVPFGFDLVNNPDLIDAIREKAKEVGIAISNYAILANVIHYDQEEYEKEIQRLKNEVDIANRLGVKRMRHDVSSFRRPMEENTALHFEKDFPLMVQACQEIADYAAQYGITTTVENHGFYVNGSDRIIRLIDAVNRPNFRMTLDVGNFLCVDEPAVAGVKKSIKYAEMIHLKDFYIRKSDQLPGIGDLFRCDSGNWFATYSGDLLRGSIVGQGDLDLWEILKIIKQSGYDGYISVEFEGMEDGRAGSELGMGLAKRIWDMI